MNPATQTARRLRRTQTKEEEQLWRALRGGRFAGFKFRRQHPVGKYFLDFYCPLAKLSIELDGFQHGMPKQFWRDRDRDVFLESSGIREIRFWNHQWRSNREGVLLDIWYELHERTGCACVARREAAQRFVPPDPSRIQPKPGAPPMVYPPGLRSRPPLP